MKANKAFTLVELVVVILIMLLFLGLAIPSMFSWVASSQIKADIATSLELHQIISDTVKSNDIDFSKTNGLLTWNSTNKLKLRSLIMREMGTPKVKIPRQDNYAFFVYLLPPYTVINLPINKTTDFDTSLSFNGVTENFLLERYPKASYPQMYASSYTTGTDSETGEITGSISVPQLLIPNILFPNNTPADNKLNSYVGCLNIRTDYD